MEMWMLKEKQIPKEFWAKVVATVVYFELVSYKECPIEDS